MVSFFIFPPFPSGVFRVCEFRCLSHIFSPLHLSDRLFPTSTNLYFLLFSLLSEYRLISGHRRESLGVAPSQPVRSSVRQSSRILFSRILDLVVQAWFLSFELSLSALSAHPFRVVCSRPPTKVVEAQQLHDKIRHETTASFPILSFALPLAFDIWTSTSNWK